MLGVPGDLIMVDNADRFPTRGQGLEPKSEGRAGVDRPSCMFEQVRRDRTIVDDRVTPVIEDYPLGEQLGAEAMGLASDRIDLQMPTQASSISSSGRSGRGRTFSSSVSAEQRWCRSWKSISSSKTARALVMKRTAPSG